MRHVAVSTWCDTRKFGNQFLETAKRCGIEPQNADPERWPGTDWRDLPWWRKSAAQAKFIREHADQYDLFMCTDSFDILFSAGWDEIEAKYLAMNSPIVFGTERYCWPKLEQAELYPPCPYPTRFLNSGMWIATTEWALKMATFLSEQAAKKDRCDSAICVDLFLSKAMPIALDNKCSLLFCCNMDSMDHLGFENGRIKALETGEFPCLWHGNGNSDLHRLFKWLNL